MIKKRKRKTNSKNNLKKINKLIFSIIGVILGLFLGLNIKVLGTIFKNDSIKIEKKYIKVVNEAIKEKIGNLEDNKEKKDEVQNLEKNEKIKYKVISVSDGDTISVKKLKNNVLDGDLIKIRLYGVDAPEKNQDYGYESKKALMNLVGDKTIKIDIKSKDRYGRSVGILYVGGRNINEELLRDGYVWYYEQYDKNNEKSRLLQENAKKNKLGLFSKKNYIEPWNFRKQKNKK